MATMQQKTAKVKPPKPTRGELAVRVIEWTNAARASLAQIESDMDDMLGEVKRGAPLADVLAERSLRNALSFLAELDTSVLNAAYRAVPDAPAPLPDVLGMVKRMKG
jgi:hypothetical protein